MRKLVLSITIMMSLSTSASAQSSDIADRIVASFQDWGASPKPLVGSSYCISDNYCQIDTDTDDNMIVTIRGQSVTVDAAPDASMAIVGCGLTLSGMTGIEFEAATIEVRRAVTELTSGETGQAVVGGAELAVTKNAPPSCRIVL